jgi:RecB family exonuclease
MSGVAFVSVACHRRIQRATAWLESRDVTEELVIVGASLDGANELARAITKKKGAVFGWHRITLPQLAATIAAPAVATQGLAPLSRLGTEAMVTRLVHRLKAEGKLGHYNAVASTPGFPRAVAAVVSELRLARLSRGVVARVTPDLAQLMGAYEDELAEMGLADWARVLALATEMATQQHRLIGVPMLLFDVPIASESELAFVQALAAKAPDILGTVPAADEPTLRQIRDGMGFQIEDLDKEAEGASALANLQRHLFDERAAPAKTDAGDTVEVFSAPGEGRECVEIARRVLMLARRGTPFDRIAVLLRSPEGYRANLEEAFARANVPVHFALGSVRPDPAGRAFCALLKCAAQDLSALRFAEYLSLSQLPDATFDGTPPEAAPRGDRWVPPDSELFATNAADETGPLDGPSDTAVASEGPVRDGQLRAPRRWEQLLVEAAVIGGRDRWRRRIDGLANALRLKVIELGDEDEAQVASLTRTLDDLAAFARYALPLIEELDRLPGAANWSEWLDRLSGLATRALRQPDRVLAVLAELTPMGPVGPVTLSEVLSVLERSLLEVAVPPPPRRYGKVFVGPVEAARGLSFDMVFVPGLAEKLFPQKVVEEPILLDTLRERIAGSLATNQARLEGERLAFALAAGAAEHRICFSYPRLDLDKGRPRVPSFYALEAMRASEGRLPDFAELARRAETATTARLGWPAPPDPTHAIDDAEHDLATLARLMASPVESAGTARYLITANPHLARALRTRYQRWGKAWTAADGLLKQSETVRAIMARHDLGVRSYSPTALQNYAKCPYRFFLQVIHRLASSEVPEAIDELDPLQRGSLIHDVQFELFARLKQEGLLPVRPANLDRAQQKLDAALSEVAARYRDDLAPAIDRVWEDAIFAIRSDLRGWLRRTSEDDSGYVPWHFELAFGIEGRPADPQSVPGAVDLDCGIQLRGSIDLVELHPAGRVRVTDHKTGKFSGKRGQLIDGGKSLQPLFYALAAEKLFAQKGRVECGRLYFCTSAGNFAEQIVPLTDQARAAASVVADAVGEAVSRPFLPAAPGEGECELCDYRIVCGPYEERRAARKPQVRLKPLRALRQSP